MNAITFSHPSSQVQQKLGDLTVAVKPDQIVWSYGLNTANFSTYGGEVVQILSMYVEDMSIEGTVGSYAELERIYKWFIFYMQVATQGHSGHEGYDTRPVKMIYHHRGWKFDIYPKSLPGFKYGRDVVAPTWKLQAAVSEFDDHFEDSVLSNQDFAGIARDGNFDPFGTTTGEIQNNEDSPWSAPTTKQYRNGDVTKWNKKTTDWYGNILPSWLGENAKYDSISADYSVPKWMQRDK